MKTKKGAHHDHDSGGQRDGDNGAAHEAEKSGAAAAIPADERDGTIEELKRELLYQAAELENFKRRTENRYRDMIRAAPEPLVRDLLPVVDNLERALTHTEDAGGALAEGIGHILSHLKSVLLNHGVEEVEAEGKKFDPNFHEALAQMPGPEDGMVLSVHEKGYLYKGKLLRPAKVIVSRAAG